MPTLLLGVLMGAVASVLTALAVGILVAMKGKKFGPLGVFRVKDKVLITVGKVENEQGLARLVSDTISPNTLSFSFDPRAALQIAAEITKQAEATIYDEYLTGEFPDGR